jgi:hypothetical protein
MSTPGLLFQYVWVERHVYPQDNNPVGRHVAPLRLIETTILWVDMSLHSDILKQQSVGRHVAPLRLTETTILWVDMSLHSDILKQQSVGRHVAPLRHTESTHGLLFQYVWVERHVYPQDCCFSESEWSDMSTHRIVVSICLSGATCLPTGLLFQWVWVERHVYLNLEKNNTVSGCCLMPNEPFFQLYYDVNKFHLNEMMMRFTLY